MEEEGSSPIVSPEHRFWSSTSRKGLGRRQEHSWAPDRTRAPPHHEQSVGPAGSPTWKPSLRSTKDTNMSFKKHLFTVTLLNSDAAGLHLITDSGSDVANLHPAGLSDPDTSLAEVPYADIHPWDRETLWGKLNPMLTQMLTFFILPSKQQGGGSCVWPSKSTLKTCTSDWLL